MQAAIKQLHSIIASKSDPPAAVQTNSASTFEESLSSSAGFKALQAAQEAMDAKLGTMVDRQDHQGKSFKDFQAAHHKSIGAL